MTSYHRTMLRTSRKRTQSLSLVTTIVALGCASGESVGDDAGIPGAGGAASGGAFTGTGGFTGGSTAGGTGGAASGGAFGTGGTPATGGGVNTGGTPATGGGINTGGTPATGGGVNTGGTPATGGGINTGGTPGSGGDIGTGGMPGSGGDVSAGGTLGSGGSGGMGSGGEPIVMEPCVVPTEEVCGTGSIVSVHCGLTYELWADNGSACMTNTAEGFMAGWNGNNYIARVGLRPEAGETVLNPVVTYSASYQTNGTSYLTVYGWTTDPLVEFYILEAHDPAYRPPGNGADVTSYPDIQVDGGTYNVRRSQRTNQPSIIGTASFPQYWSLRTQNRTSGTINVAEHFAAWQQSGLEMGDIYEVSMAVEGFGSSGTADVQVTFE